MTLYVDSANLKDIEAVLERGVAHGITTNPSLVSKEVAQTYDAFVRQVVKLARNWHCPVSVELTTGEPTEMVPQAVRLFAEQDYRDMVIKVPVGWDELNVVRTLLENHIRVNVTAVMSYDQAILAAEAGADFISIFWNRVRDYGADPCAIVDRVRTTLDRLGFENQIIVGSIRQQDDIGDALMAGAHIVTVPYRFFAPMTCHPKTDEVVQQFLHDYAVWSKA